MRKGIILFFGLIFSSNAQAQYDYFSIDSTQVQLIQQALDSIYDLNFKGAMPLIDKLESEIPDYPDTHLLKAYYYIWMHSPIKIDHPNYDSLIVICENTLHKAEQVLKEKDEDLESIFFALSIHAILARLYVDVGLNWKAIKEAKKAYKYIKMGMKYTDQFPELNLYCGIYNYYRVKYPEDNPYVRPILWFFMNGDKEIGLEMLQDGSEKGVFTKIECLSYLFFINMRYEFIPEKSLLFARDLNEKYPNNKRFSALLVENKIYQNDFTEVENMICQLEDSDYGYYQYVGTIYLGLVYELYYSDYIVAIETFQRAILYGLEHDVTTPHYESLSYLGLGRTYKKLDKTSEANKYLKKAASISEYGFVREEAKSLMK